MLKISLRNNFQQGALVCQGAINVRLSKVGVTVIINSYITVHLASSLKILRFHGIRDFSCGDGSEFIFSTSNITGQG